MVFIFSSCICGHVNTMLAAIYSQHPLVCFIRLNSLSFLRILTLVVNISLSKKLGSSSTLYGDVRTEFWDSQHPCTPRTQEAETGTSEISWVARLTPLASPGSARDHDLINTVDSDHGRHLMSTSILHTVHSHTCTLPHMSTHQHT